MLVTPKLWTGDLDCFRSLMYDFFSLWENGPCHLTPQMEGKQYSVFVKEMTWGALTQNLVVKSFVGVALESGKGNLSRFSVSFFNMLYHNLLLLRSKKELCKWSELFLVKTNKIPCNLSTVALIGVAWAWSLWNSVELHLHLKGFWSKMLFDLCLRCLAMW